MDGQSTPSVFPAFSNRPRRLLRNHTSLVMWGQLLIDSVLVVGLLWALAEWRNGDFGQSYRHLAVVSLLVMWIVFHHQGIYRRFSGFARSLVRIGVAWGAVLTVLLAVAFITKSTEDFSRIVIVAWAVGCYFGQVLIHRLTYKAVSVYKHSYADKMPSIVVGSHYLAEHLVCHLNSNRWLPDRVVGIVDDDANAVDKWPIAESPFLGAINQLPALIKEQGVRRVYIALPMSCAHMVDQIYDDLARLNVDVVWAPDIFRMNLLNHSVREVGGIPLLSLSESPMMSGGQAFIKNRIDGLLAVMALVLLSPLLLITALAIKLDSRGPVIFKQQRHGWDGRVISVWKFRSMYVDQPAPDQVRQATRDDPRITRVGRFIRRTSIDELPQLINVIQGHMSMVGPRPHAVVHNEEYGRKINAYLMRHRIKPGITGLAQVNGCRGETETTEKMIKRVEFDLAYINNWSIWLDFKILLKTPFTLFSKDIY